MRHRSFGYEEEHTRLESCCQSQGLIGLVQVLYAASKDNQIFLHARLALGGDVMKPYKATIDRWLWPDLLRHQDISVTKAKKAIAD